MSKPQTFLGAGGSDSEDAPLSPPSKSPKASQIDEDAESSEDEIVRPRGRFAARMMGSPKDATAGATREEAAPQSARERMRKLLGLDASTSPRKEAQEQAKPTDTTRSVEASEDDDEDLPSTPPRRNRTQRQPTPDSVAEASPSPSSPGMFVSPGQKSVAGDDTEDDTALPKPKKNRFKALVDKKRREREAKEAEEEAKRAARPASYEDDDSPGVTDDEAGHKLTQQARPRPTRKAGKKAIEEMNRETQRMERSMQLAHQAVTKKKITKEALFARFNYKHAGAPAEAKSSSRPSTPASDSEMKDVATPPSSPPPRSAEKVVHDVIMDDDALADDFLPVDQLPPSSPRTSKDRKGKGVAT
ncbi:hypothetical protein IMZ48_47515, partial [Candidatus Bathyarchaeota archaeon]|nr:hypothetical protein [Candidatus Bathyarchaeota archaeon]